MRILVACEYSGVVRDAFRAQGHSAWSCDLLWFIAALAADHGFTLEDVARANLVKFFTRKDNNTLGGSGDDR